MPRARPVPKPVRPKSRAVTRGAGPGARGGARIRRPVKILFLDVDGTLTDGRIHFDGSGDGRSFWIRDGIALEWACQRGVLPVVISGRGSQAVEKRMADLGLEAYLGEKDKIRVAERILAREGVTWDECVMIGDDLPDVPLMRRVGWPIAVHDASPEVVRIAKTVTLAHGGKGAVREAVERVLRHNGTWDDVLASYQAR